MSRTPAWQVSADGSVVLRLDGACVQTTAERAHRELTDTLLENAGPAPEQALALPLLEEFLTTSDFRRLRSEHPALAGTSPCRVRLSRSEDGAISWLLLDLS
jgi:hypothetical protein